MKNTFYFGKLFQFDRIYFFINETIVFFYMFDVIMLSYISLPS